jgi:hypothetical protein
VPRSDILAVFRLAQRHVPVAHDGKQFCFVAGLLDAAHEVRATRQVVGDLVLRQADALAQAPDGRRSHIPFAAQQLRQRGVIDCEEVGKGAQGITGIAFAARCQFRLQACAERLWRARWRGGEDASRHAWILCAPGLAMAIFPGKKAGQCPAPPACSLAAVLSKCCRFTYYRLRRMQ